MSKGKAELEAQNRILMELLTKLAHGPDGAAAALVAAARQPAKRATKREEPTTPHKDTNWHDIIANCPKCGHEGPVDTDFGIKTVRGIVRKQSWCKTCRATTNYYRAERKYSKRRS